MLLCTEMRITISEGKRWVVMVASRNAALSHSTFPKLCSSKSVVVPDRSGRRDHLGIVKHAAETPRRGVRIINRISVSLYYHCAALAGSFPFSAESFIIPLFSSTPSRSLSGFPNTTSPLAMLSSSNPSRPFKTPRI